MNTAQTPAQKITKSYVDRLSTPETGQAFIRDTELKGFACVLPHPAPNHSSWKKGLTAK
jgi:hypothetical protein